MEALCTWLTKVRTFQSLHVDHYKKVGCPISYTDSVHYAILFVETTTMHGTTKPIHQLPRRILCLLLVMFSIWQVQNDTGIILQVYLCSRKSYRESWWQHREGHRSWPLVGCVGRRWGCLRDSNSVCIETASCTRWLRWVPHQVSSSRQWQLHRSGHRGNVILISCITSVHHETRWYTDTVTVL